MPIKYPVRVKENEQATPFVCIIDASDRPVAGGILAEEVDEIVVAMNMYHGGAQPRKKSRKVKIEEELRRSDLTAQLAGREHILRFGAAKKRT